MDDDLSTATLVKRAVHANARAWDCLVRRYAQLLRAVCRRYGMTGSDADDVCGVVWMRLVSSLADLREPATLPAWLATTVRRECLDQLRRRQRQILIAVDDQWIAHEHGPPDARLLLEERRIVVRKGCRTIAGSRPATAVDAFLRPAKALRRHQREARHTDWRHRANPAAPPDSAAPGTAEKRLCLSPSSRPFGHAGGGGIGQAAGMGYITHIRIHCIRQEDWAGSDDLDFYVDTTYVGRVTIGTGETRDVDGSTMLFQHGFVDPGQTITVYEDDFDPDDLVLSHSVTDSEIHNGLSTNNTSGSCSYTFEFTFEPAI